MTSCALDSLCQPFSKSGAQRGMDETRGTLYWNILRIIQERRPAVVLLKMSAILQALRHRHEWQVIIETLRSEGYRVVRLALRLLSSPLCPQKKGVGHKFENAFS